MQVIIIIATLLGGLAAIIWFRDRWGSLLASVLQKLFRSTDVHLVAVYHSNDWDGFDVDSDDDVLFQLALNVPIPLVRHVALNKGFKPEVFTSRVSGLRAVPESSPDPYGERASIELLVGSTPSEVQSHEEYDVFIGNYAPIFPDDVTVTPCDGSNEAMWLWRCHLPDHWLEPIPPFVREENRADLKRLLENWISAHESAISNVQDGSA